MSNDEINKIKELEEAEDRVDKEEQQEIEEDEKTTKTTVATIKKDKEVDYSKTIRHGIIDLSSYTMIGEEKRKRFSNDLLKDETINEFVDDQFYTKFLKSNNPYIRAGIVYSYLYLKNYNTL